MHKVAVDALEASKAALKPGRPIGEVFDAHAKVLDAAGYRQHRMNATGYSPAPPSRRTGWTGR
jgi:Xaa-Pro dipeptidase